MHGPMYIYQQKSNILHFYKKPPLVGFREISVLFFNVRENLDDGGRKYLRNIGELLLKHTAFQSKRQPS
jgi:hypothetical protein